MFYTQVFYVFLVQAGRVQQNLETTYATAGEYAVFNYLPPASNQVMSWKAHLNGSNIVFVDVARNFAGAIIVFKQWDLPP